MKQPIHVADQDILLRRFQEVDRDLRVRNLKIVCILTIILVAAGSSLDHFQYPELFWSIFTVRLLCNIALLIVLFSLYTSFGRRHTHLCGTAWALAPSVTISWMIYIAEGSSSPFYAGLNLVIIAYCLFVPCTMGEAMSQCIVVMTTYFTACLLHTSTPLNVNLLSNNLIFMSMTSVLGVAACHVSHLKRISDFQLRYELDRQNQQLIELDRLKSQFFANVSHELRTPLTLILSPTENLLRNAKELPDDVKAVLRLVRDNGLRLLRLINDLLELARLEDGRSRVKCESIDLGAFVPGIVDSVRRLASDKGVAMNFHGAKPKLITKADYSRLEKVLLNLLMNAVKFTDKGDKIDVRLGEEDNYAVVEVEDSGIGIAQDDLPFIFDRFRQVDGSSARKYQGAGIGLALAREIVEEFDGRLDVESRLGEGTVFKVRLPLAPGEEVVRLPPSDSPNELDHIEKINHAADRFLAAETECDENIKGEGAYTVLLVEDEPDLRSFLASVLTSEYKVLQAGDGSSGLEMARKHKPNLMLLDLMLPGMDGLQVCETIKKDEVLRGIKVILLTARTDEAAKIAALERGADDFLIKPFSTLEVKTRLTNLLNSALLEDSLRAKNSELETALKRLRETEAQLVQTAKMNALGSLAGGILHEINNPLNYTLAALQLARMNVAKDDNEMDEILTDIEEGMGRVGDIVSSLREFAYPDAASAGQHFALKECLESAKKLAAGELHGIALHANVDSDCIVIGAKTQITHLFINFFINSANALKKVDDARRPEITVSAHANHDRIYVEVADNGTGVEPKNLERLFEPFFTTSDVGKGMGLGLSICYTILKKHDGNISIDSKPGAWTKISFDLPLAKG